MKKSLLVLTMAIAMILSGCKSNDFVDNPTCNDGEQYNEETQQCELIVPSCSEDEELNEESNTCEPITPEVPSEPIDVEQVLHDVVDEATLQGAEFFGMYDTISEERLVSYFGDADYPEMRNLHIFMPMMTPNVSYIIMFEVDEDKVEDVKDTLFENINEAQQVCVSFDKDEDMVIDSHNNLIVVIVNPAFKDIIADAFDTIVE